MKRQTYIALKIQLDNPEKYRDILISDLIDFPFEGLLETEEGLIVYFSQAEFMPQIALQLQERNNFIQAIQTEQVPEINWNKKWEQEYPYVVIDEQCLIRAPFHSINKNYPIEITIQPQMSFGTGHHPTTFLMVQQMLHIVLQGKYILDMGCGTGLLAILAAKLGAAHVHAIDIDPWSWENATQNIRLNEMEETIEVHLGGSGAIPDRLFDVIVANINKNVLIKDMENYQKHLKNGGLLLLSGIVTGDLAEMEKHLNRCFLKTLKRFTKDEWACILAEG